MENKVAIITGAAGGIGEAIALHLAAKGARVVLADLDQRRLEALAARVNEAGGEAAVLRADVTNRNDMSALVAYAVKQFGKVDVLISNAGIGKISLLDDLRVDEWISMVDVNVKGLLFGIAAALPVFRAQGFGHFVNTASTAGFKTVANQAVYSGTKFAIRAISEGLRQEAGDKIRVTIVSPGFVRTNFVNTVTNDELRDQLVKSRDEFAMSPDAIAQAMAFAIDQPSEIDVGEIVVRPTAQG